MAQRRIYRYVGPGHVAAAAVEAPPGTPVVTLEDLLVWISAHAGEDQGWATYVVDLEGRLLLAPRRSEHVAAANGGPVLAAGEIRFDEDGAVVEVSNLSTGFCPDLASWTAVAHAIDTVGVARPSSFTSAFIFRRCEGCGQRNVIKDEWFVCAVCGAELPRAYNF